MHANTHSYDHQHSHTQTHTHTCTHLEAHLHTLRHVTHTLPHMALRPFELQPIFGCPLATEVLVAHHVQVFADPGLFFDGNGDGGGAGRGLCACACVCACVRMCVHMYVCVCMRACHSRRNIRIYTHMRKMQVDIKKHLLCRRLPLTPYLKTITYSRRRIFACITHTDSHTHVHVRVCTHALRMQNTHTYTTAPPILMHIYEEEVGAVWAGEKGPKHKPSTLKHLLACTHTHTQIQTHTHIYELKLWITRAGREAFFQT